MAIHSSILAWRIPWTEEPGRLLYFKKSNFSFKIYICFYSPRCQKFNYFHGLMSNSGIVVQGGRIGKSYTHSPQTTDTPNLQLFMDQFFSKVNLKTM